LSEKVINKTFIFTSELKYKPEVTQSLALHMRQNIDEAKKAVTKPVSLLTINIALSVY
jgi:hypothetical protein